MKAIAPPLNRDPAGRFLRPAGKPAVRHLCALPAPQPGAYGAYNRLACYFTLPTLGRLGRVSGLERQCWPNSRSSVPAVEDDLRRLIERVTAPNRRARALYCPAAIDGRIRDRSEARHVQHAWPEATAR